MMMRRLVVIACACLALAAGAQATEFSADEVASFQGDRESGRLYVKSPAVTRSESMGMITINKYPFIYQLFEDTKRYVVTNVEESSSGASGELRPWESGDFQSWVAAQGLTEQGAEKIQGFDTRIYQGEVVLEAGLPPMPIKVWYAQRLDYPVRHEVTVPANAHMGLGVETVTVQLENIEIGPQPDQLFELPDGYTEVASLHEAMGLSEMLPGMFDDGSGPSAEQMEEMLRQLQQMLQDGGGHP
ncbi:hypothetical protein ABC977_06740 [Thioalkalicoccus limnaeus]|uniref:DUF4412 domain-containing protein n=1 Tax=Thioalkalicoccus limnaeus TaxID=120681 RepID=A0ABV4BC82_9GAMM